MYKLVALLAFVAAVSAAPGFVGAPLAYSAPVVAHAPVAYAAPVLAHAPVVAHAPVATSYANTYKVSVKSAPVVHAVHAAPVVHAVHAAPVLHAAPVAYAASPIVKSYGLVH